MKRFLLIGFVLTFVWSLGYIVGEKKSSKRFTKIDDFETHPSIFVNRPDVNGVYGREVVQLISIRYVYKGEQLMIEPEVKLVSNGIPELTAHHWIISVGGHSYLAVPATDNP